METLPDSSTEITPADRPIDPKILLATLRARFPVLAEFKPLKIKIHLDIRAALEGEGVANIRVARALAWHVADRWYLQSLAKGGHRFNLAGEVDGEVTEEQRRRATERLNERRQNKKPKKKPSASPPAPVDTPPAKPMETRPPDPPAAGPLGRPVLRLKPKAGPVITANVTRREATP